MDRKPEQPGILEMLTEKHIEVVTTVRQNNVRDDLMIEKQAFEEHDPNNELSEVLFLLSHYPEEVIQALQTNPETTYLSGINLRNLIPNERNIVALDFDGRILPFIIQRTSETQYSFRNIHIDENLFYLARAIEHDIGAGMSYVCLSLENLASKNNDFKILELSNRLRQIATNFAGLTGLSFRQIFHTENGGVPLLLPLEQNKEVSTLVTEFYNNKAQTLLGDLIESRKYLGNDNVQLFGVILNAYGLIKGIGVAPAISLAEILPEFSEYHKFVLEPALSNLKTQESQITIDLQQLPDGIEHFTNFIPEIHAALLNLTKNSLKHGFTNTIQAEKHIKIEFQLTDAGLVIIHSDNGNGGAVKINEQFKESGEGNIFSFGNTGGNGTGIGAFIVRSCVTRTGGTVEEPVYLVPGRQMGSKFIITIPW